MTTLEQVLVAETRTSTVPDLQRRRLLQLFIASYLFIVFVGAIRKWLFPSFMALYFLQDIPILAAYIYAVTHKLYKLGFLAWSIFFLSVVLLAQSLLQFAVGNLSLKVALVGYHAYLFYLPMLIIFPFAMDARGRATFIRLYLLLNLPMSLLAVLQSRASAGAFINRTTGGKGFGGLGEDLARVSGTFNFAAFYAIWLSICFALCTSEWLLPQSRRSIQHRGVLFASTFGCLVSLAVSGERGAVGTAIIALTGLATVAVLLKNYRALLIIFVLPLAFPVAVGVSYLISPRMLNGFENRITNSHNVYRTQGRILNLMASFIPPTTDPVGLGIGYGVDGSHVGEVGGYQFTYQLSETDLQRNYLELGVLAGLTYAAWRLFFCLGLILVSVRLAVENISPHALPLALIIFGQAYVGDWTRNATMTVTQDFLAAAFILGAFYFQDDYPADISSGKNFTKRFL